MNKPTGTTQQNLDRALELLEKMASTGVSMTVTEISNQLGITRATAYSMLNSLLSKNYIERDPETNKYSIGYKVYELGTMYRHRYPFLHVAERHIATMSANNPFRINVMVLKPPMTAVVLLTKDASLLPQMVLGYVLPAYASSGGKILLAFHPQAEELVHQIEFRQYTSHTITEQHDLLNQLQKIRQKGYAIEDEEVLPQRYCVAAPVRNFSGEVIAAISFSGMKETMQTIKEDAITKVTALARDISSDLGYSNISL